MKEKPTESREGVKGGFPLAGSRDSVPCGVWGNAPTVPRQTYSKEEVKQSRGSEASRAQTSRVLRRAPQAALSTIYAVSRQMGATTMLGFQT